MDRKQLQELTKAAQLAAAIEAEKKAEALRISAEEKLKQDLETAQSNVAIVMFDLKNQLECAAKNGSDGIEYKLQNWPHLSPENPVAVAIFRYCKINGLDCSYEPPWNGMGRIFGNLDVNPNQRNKLYISWK